MVYQVRSPVNEVWIGYQKENGDSWNDKMGILVWLNTALEPTSYTNWLPRQPIEATYEEPDNLCVSIRQIGFMIGGIEVQHLSEYGFPFVPGWMARECHAPTQNRYICQTTVLHPPTTPTPLGKSIIINYLIRNLKQYCTLYICKFLLLKNIVFSFSIW